MNSIVKIGDFLLERLKERSTWTGMFLVLTSIGVTLPEGVSEYVVVAGVGIAGVIEFFWPEPKA
jgi:hypothetical protein